MARSHIEYARAYEALKPYGFTHDDLASLHRWEATLTRLSENQCNGWPTWRNGHLEYGWSQEANDREQKQAERIERRVTRLVEDGRHPGVTVSFQGDPRGGAIRLLLPADDAGHRVHNSWDGESWVIDW